MFKNQGMALVADDGLRLAVRGFSSRARLNSPLLCAPRRSDPGRCGRRDVR